MRTSERERVELYRLGWIEQSAVGTMLLLMCLQIIIIVIELVHAVVHFGITLILRCSFRQKKNKSERLLTGSGIKRYPVNEIQCAHFQRFH